jgi:hypothetical protein
MSRERERKRLDERVSPRVSKRRAPLSNSENASLNSNEGKHISILSGQASTQRTRDLLCLAAARQRYLRPSRHTTHPQTTRTHPVRGWTYKARET